MDYEDRKQQIVEYLKKFGRMDYGKAAQLLQVSEATVRRDFELLEKEGYLIRIRGGAKASLPTVSIAPEILYSREREIIGEIAAGFVKSKELLYIGSGNTTMALVDHIEGASMSVITNGIPQLEALTRKGIQTFLLAGFLKQSTRALVGSRAIEMLKEFKFDQAFLGANGLSRDLKILSADEYEYEIKKIAIANARQCFILLDHSKFDKTAMYEISGSSLQNVYIITDKVVDWIDVKYEAFGEGYVFRLKDAIENRY